MPALNTTLHLFLAMAIWQVQKTAVKFGFAHLDPMIEEAVRDSIQRTATGAYLAMPPDMAKDVIAAVRKECFTERGAAAVLLTQPDVRRFMRRLLEVDLPDAAVLSYQELAPEVTVQPLGRVSL